MYLLYLILIGDWGLGIGDWGLGPIPNPQSPIPNPQSPEIIVVNNYDVYKVKYVFIYCYIHMIGCICNYVMQYKYVFYACFIYEM